jgi:hypothetical protein
LAEPDEDSVYLSCTEELKEEDEGVLREIQAKHVAKKKKKSEPWLAWEWLKNMKALPRNGHGATWWTFLP